MNYYVKIKGKGYGPFSAESMLDLIRQGRVGKMTQVSTDNITWSNAGEFDELYPKSVSGSPFENDSFASAMLQPGIQAANQTKEWFISTDGKSGRGPYSASEVSGMLQNGTLNNNTTLVWRQGENARYINQEPTFSGGNGVGNSNRGNPGAGPYCTYCGAPVSPHAKACMQCGAGPLDHRSFCRQCGASVSPQQIVCTSCGASTVNRHIDERYRSDDIDVPSKIVAALLAFFLGGFGAHHFYLGKPLLGVLYILLCWTFIPAIIALIEGICYLSMSDSKFERKYSRY